MRFFSAPEAWSWFSDAYERYICLIAKDILAAQRAMSGLTVLSRLKKRLSKYLIDFRASGLVARKIVLIMKKKKKKKS